MCRVAERENGDILMAVKVLSLHMSMISDGRDSAREVNLVAVQGRCLEDLHDSGFALGRL